MTIFEGIKAKGQLSALIFDLSPLHLDKVSSPVVTLSIWVTES